MSDPAALYIRYLNAVTATLTGAPIAPDPTLSVEEALATTLGAIDGATAPAYMERERAKEDARGEDTWGEPMSYETVYDPDGLAHAVQYHLKMLPEQAAARARNAKAA